MTVPLPLLPSTRPRGRRRAGSAGRAAGALLGLLALSAHLLLPLVYTCRTYRSLFLDAPASCCAAKPCCAAGPAREDAGSWRHDGVDCPFCKAASPFRHANASRGPAPTWRGTQLEVRLPPPLRSVPSAPPDLTSSSPRSPPADSGTSEPIV